MLRVWLATQRVLGGEGLFAPGELRRIVLDAVAHPADFLHIVPGLVSAFEGAPGLAGDIFEDDGDAGSDPLTAAQLEGLLDYVLSTLAPSSSTAVDGSQLQTEPLPTISRALLQLLLTCLTSAIDLLSRRVAGRDVSRLLLRLAAEVASEREKFTEDSVSSAPVQGLVTPLLNPFLLRLKSLQSLRYEQVAVVLPSRCSNRYT